MWRREQVPQDFKDATIVHLYKRKGNQQLCDNHKGISLLKIAGILLNRLNGHLEQGLLPESQCGFRRHRRTTDMIFTARQLQEKCQEMRTYLYTTFVDLTKAFDKVNRDGLWKVMHKFGCPEWFTPMVSQLHDGMTARVTDNGTVSEAFAVTKVVKQGCVLAPNLFSLINQMTQKQEDLHAPDANTTVEARWCQVPNFIQSTALEVLGRARRQHQDWFDCNDANISILLMENNGLHKAYMDRRTDATKAAFFRSHCLVQHRLREKQGHDVI
ncbi:unnamed protein product [Schistocephalus solidus]|uniref:Reverse transcriptase domain-containing protein n=1 Tax=Schistocephalus solidus TaxID=70667 RepID=A0A183TJU2_SCHSO|nr:unnamed protein product [Schistocephalus solidus]